MLQYTWKQKNIHIKYKKQPKNNKKIIIQTKQRKKDQKLNFKCNINVKVMTSGEYKKNSALNLLISIIS